METGFTKEQWGRFVTKSGVKSFDRGNVFPAAVLRRENAKDVVTEPSVGDEVNKERREQTCLDMQMLKQVQLFKEQLVTKRAPRY